MLLNNYQTALLEAGLDEAGRGCYAGPVFAAAVILPPNFYHPLLNDSKKLTEKNRAILKPIIEAEALAWAVASVSHIEIDEINILLASIKAMHLAVAALKKKPKYLIVDGNRFKPYKKLPHTCIVKGDGKYASIAAASILAKTHRDAYLDTLHKAYPMYGWNKNKGYGTAVHRSAIEVHGLCEHHRKSFAILPTHLHLL